MYTLPSCQHIFVIGAQKAGTTWLQHTFDKDSRFFVPKSQEVHFFDRRQDEDISQYLNKFAQCESHQISVDVTPAYLTAPGVIEKIIHNNNIFRYEPKFIVTLREPVARAFAAYQMYLNYGRNYNSFWDALKNDPEIREKSLYGKHLEKWFDVFPSQNFKIIFFEDIIYSADNVYSELTYFLNLKESLSTYYKETPINTGGLDKNWFIPIIRRKGGSLLRHLGCNGIRHIIKKSSLFRWLENKNKKKLYLDSHSKDIAIKFFLEDVNKLDNLVHLGYIKEKWGYS
jgi:hypothetical protein